MAGTRYRTQRSAYGTVGSSALAYPRYSEERDHGVRYEQPMQHTRPPAPRRRGQSGVRALTMLVMLGLVFSLLCGISISKRVTAGNLQQQIAQAQKDLKAVRDENYFLEMQLSASTDGERIRNYAVNTLHMSRIRAEDIRKVSMPDTRPNGPSVEVQKIQTEEGGFLAMLADLLRAIRI